MAAQVIFRTQGVATSFVNTTNRIPIFLTSGIATRFLNTFQPTPFFQTGGVSSSFLTTNVTYPIFLTPSEAVAFFTTADKGTTKLLVPTIGTLEVASGYTYINVPDATGDFDATTNPGGYNILPLPFNAARPYRENVALWTVYRIWNVYGNNTQSPDAQNEQYDNPYEYQLFIPTQTNAAQEEEIIRGVYEIILIAAPYFNETDTGGTYLSESASEQTAYIVDGIETEFTNLANSDYLYYFDAATGSLLEMGTVLKVFSDTTLALISAAVNTPASGTTPIMYGSATSVSVTASTGTAIGLSTSPYYTITGSGTDFDNFVADEYVYYIDSGTLNYVYLGQVFAGISLTEFYLYNKDENSPNPSVGDFVLSSATLLPEIINSDGTFQGDLLNTIFGVNTDFNKFTPSQTLYYQDQITGELINVGVIDSIIGDIELLLTTAPVNIPSAGDRLFASSDASISFTPSNGQFSSISAPLEYYTLSADGGSFNTFSVDDYIYLVGQDGVYNELGQTIRIPSNDAMDFYSVQNNIQVNQGDFVVGSPSSLSLIEIGGTYGEYYTQGYYNLEGDGTTFLTTAEPQQYLFYEDANGQFIETGQIYQVFDNTNVWLYDAPEGSPDNTTQLFTSYSLNTETASYANYRGNFDLYEIANQFPGWFVGSTGIIVDELLINCLSRLRYEFLQGVMCGRCDEGYLHTYSLYVGMLSAMEVGEWQLAVDFYNKLKVICAEQDGSSCGC
jgi:hypothetical protein